MQGSARTLMYVNCHSGISLQKLRYVVKHLRKGGCRSRDSNGDSPEHKSKASESTYSVQETKQSPKVNKTMYE